MAREVDPKMEHEVAVFRLEAKTEIELWWEKMRGAVQAYQKAKITEVVNSNLGGKSRINDQWGRDDHPRFSQKDSPPLLPLAALTNAGSLTTPSPSICNIPNNILMPSASPSLSSPAAGLQSRGEAMRVEVHEMGA